MQAFNLRGAMTYAGEVFSIQDAPPGAPFLLVKKHFNNWTVYSIDCGLVVAAASTADAAISSANVQFELRGHKPSFYDCWVAACNAFEAYKLALWTTAAMQHAYQVAGTPRPLWETTSIFSR